MNSKRFSNGTLGHVVQTHICRLPQTRMITYRQMSSGGLEEKRLTKQILLSSGHETFLQKEKGKTWTWKCIFNFQNLLSVQNNILLFKKEESISCRNSDDLILGECLLWR